MLIEDYEYSKRPEGGFKFTATLDAADGSGNHLVTDHLAMMYDLIMSMDQACSGWCDAEDNERLAEIAKLCGFDLPDCVQRHPVTPGVCQAGKVDHDGPHWLKAYIPIDNGTLVGFRRLEWETPK